MIKEKINRIDVSALVQSVTLVWKFKYMRCLAPVINSVVLGKIQGWWYGDIQRNFFLFIRCCYVFNPMKQDALAYVLPHPSLNPTQKEEITQICFRIGQRNLKNIGESWSVSRTITGKEGIGV